MSLDDTEARMRASSAFWTAIIGFAVLGALALVVIVPAVEHELDQQASKVLQDTDWLTHHMDGRTLVLTGEAPDGAARSNVQAKVRRLGPLYRVQDDTTVWTETAAPAAAAAEDNAASGIALPAIPDDGAADTSQGSVPLESIPPETAPPETAPSPADPVDNTPESLPPAPPPAVSDGVSTAVAEVVTETPTPVVVASPARNPAGTGLPADVCQDRIDAAMRSEIIRFQSGSSEILPASYPLLQDLARVITACNAPVEVAGHTDDLGEASENQALSLKRAQAVVSFLVNKGANASLLTAAGYGEAEPVSPNTTWAGRKANRRIAFKALNIAAQATPRTEPESR